MRTGAASAALVMVTACGGGAAPASISDTLTRACADARDRVAAAPAPTDAGSDAAFTAASHRATRTVAEVADDLATRGDDRTITDLTWQLYRFPRHSGPDDMLATAHEATAAILRIDGFARTLRVPECAAATWRPDAWRAIAERHGGPRDDNTFRRELRELCADTFPEPALLEDGVPLLTALVAATDGGTTGGSKPAEIKRRVVARLSSVRASPSATAEFITDFSNALPRLRPSAGLEDEYTALLAAFLHVDAVVPQALPRDPPPEIREPVHAALDELEVAWEALGVPC